jgi:phosphoribosyl-ATP pyrophosphohydrolase/phosphoribosyl-AMP cyclohydrolase
MSWLDQVKWNEQGLVPAIAQEAETGAVLTMAWMDREALASTETTGLAHYWSRSRGRLWRKGERSGHVQRVREIRLDCDNDAILLVVEQQGGIACHSGSKVAPGAPSNPCSGTRRRFMATDDVLQRVASTIAAHRDVDPVQSYVATLFAKGKDAIIKKIGEEATEAVMAAKDGDKIRLTAELADLWFHCLVLLESMGLGPEDLLAELERREGTSGIAEKAARG